MVTLAERAPDEVAARGLLEIALEDGSALEVFRRWVQAQGGDPGVVDEDDLLPASTHTRTVPAGGTGYVASFDAELVGRAAMLMGAGRATMDDDIDPASGLVLSVRVGDRVEPDTPLATLHTSSESLLDAGEERLLAAARLSDHEPPRRPLFREV